MGRFHLMSASGAGVRETLTTIPREEQGCKASTSRVMKDGKWIAGIIKLQYTVCPILDVSVSVYSITLKDSKQKMCF